MVVGNTSDSPYIDVWDYHTHKCAKTAAYLHVGGVIVSRIDWGEPACVTNDREQFCLDLLVYEQPKRLASLSPPWEADQLP